MASFSQNVEILARSVNQGLERQKPLDQLFEELINPDLVQTTESVAEEALSGRLSLFWDQQGSYSNNGHTNESTASNMASGIFDADQAWPLSEGSVGHDGASSLLSSTGAPVSVSYPHVVAREDFSLSVSLPDTDFIHDQPKACFSHLSFSSSPPPPPPPPPPSSPSASSESISRSPELGFINSDLPFAFPDNWSSRPSQSSHRTKSTQNTSSLSTLVVASTHDSQTFSSLDSDMLARKKYAISSEQHFLRTAPNHTLLSPPVSSQLKANCFPSAIYFSNGLSQGQVQAETEQALSPLTPDYMQRPSTPVPSRFIEGTSYSTSTPEGSDETLLGGQSISRADIMGGLLTPPTTQPIPAAQWAHDAGPSASPEFSSQGDKAEGWWECNSASTSSDPSTCGANAASNFSGLGIAGMPSVGVNASLVSSNMMFMAGTSSAPVLVGSHAAPNATITTSLGDSAFSASASPNGGSRFAMSPLLQHLPPPHQQQQQQQQQRQQLRQHQQHQQVQRPQQQPQQQLTSALDVNQAIGIHFPRQHNRQHAYGSAIAVARPSRTLAPIGIIDANGGRLRFPRTSSLSPQPGYPTTAPRSPSAYKAHRRSRSNCTHQNHGRKSSGHVANPAASSSRHASVNFVNFTPDDRKKILNGVAPSGSSKTKARREKEAAEKRRKFSEAAKRAVLDAGGDLGALEREGVLILNGCI